MLTSPDKVIRHVNEGRPRSLQVGGKQREDAIIGNGAIEQPEGFQVALFIDFHVDYMMFTGAHPTGSAAGKYFLHGSIAGENAVFFKKLNG